jgi:hypothetical protein
MASRSPLLLPAASLALAIGLGCDRGDVSAPPPSEATSDGGPARTFSGSTNGRGPDGGCFDADPLTQRHGSPCLCCHADEFSVAGSVDPNASPVALVVVTDAVGDARYMAPNQYGNFFRHFSLVPPLRAIAYGPDGRSLEMKSGAPHGDCNACHRPDGAAAPLHGP